MRMVNVHDYYFQLFQLFLRQLFLICNFQKNRFTQASLCAIIYKLCVKNAKSTSAYQQRGIIAEVHGLYLCTDALRTDTPTPARHTVN